MRKTKLISCGVVLLVSIFSLVFFVFSIFYGKSLDNIEPPPLLGNKEDNINRINEEKVLPRNFSFLVVSDTKTSNIFEAFYNSDLYPDEADFTIIGGDFVKDPEWGHHNFFIQEFIEWGLKKPIFLIAGNHDIALEEKYKEKANAFLVDDFKKTYGPLDFCFRYSGCLFIGVDNNYNETYLDYLREALSAESDGALIKFVFMHIPPPSMVPVSEFRPLKKEGEFFDIVDEFNVDYVIASDYHSYLRHRRGRTNYIITGGGGANLYDENSSFYHAIMFHVDPKNREVAEFIYPLKKSLDFGDDIEIFMVTKTYPYFKYHPPLGFAILALNAAVIGLLIWGFFSLIGRRD
ncbi:MAG: metallophosphoesterase [Deltaproteobacteria bacterium]|uniref:Metallophosphoesterase n=1 Tax=Candidatus Zymogenus saltonus TaxID=2844893 RepID=A0A9D8KBM4_9DELT|nr:metallophosphoesterase [Candidatus Zymogenus saltonus]